MCGPDLRWWQQRESEDNETANKIGIETGMVIALLALLSGGLTVGLERNHQREENKNDVRGVTHHSGARPKLSQVCWGGGGHWLRTPGSGVDGGRRALTWKVPCEPVLVSETCDDRADVYD